MKEKSKNVERKDVKQKKIEEVKFVGLIFL